MSGSTIGGFIGLAIGTFFGAPTVGYAIGSAIGGAIDPEKIKVRGARLGDLRVQQSTYGATLPILFGRLQVTGQVIECSDIRETAHKKKSSGKGGPITVTTTHTYSADIAIAFCEGPILSVVKIKADQALIYDISDPLNADAISQSVLKADAFVVYPGTEDQFPDPTFEALYGVGNVPAYLGTAYIVLKNYDLTPTQGRLPNFTFEVVCGDGASTQFSEVAFLYLPSKPAFTQPSHTGSMVIHSNGSGLRVLPDYSQYAAAVAPNFSTAVQTDRSETETQAMPAGISDGNGHALCLDLGNGTGVYTCFDIAGPDYPFTDADIAVGYGPYILRAALSGTGVAVRTTTVETDSWRAGRKVGAWVPCVDNLHCIATLYKNIGGSVIDKVWVLLRWNGTTFDKLEERPLLTTDSGGTVLADISNTAGKSCGYGGTSNAAIVESDLSHVWLYTNAGNTIVSYAINPDDGSWVASLISGGPPGRPIMPAAQRSSLWADLGIAYATYNDADNFVLVDMLSRLTLDPNATTTLDYIVSDLCMRAGAKPENIDVTALEDIPVKGFKAITDRSPISGPLEQIEQIYSIANIERGTQIVFFPLTPSTVPDWIIPESDLGASFDDTDAPPLETERTNDNEIPKRIDLTYASAANDYQNNTARGQRAVANVDQVQSIETTFVLDDDEAAGIAARLAREAEIHRGTRSFTLPGKYAAMEPADLVSFTVKGVAYLIRVSQVTAQGNCLQVVGTDSFPANYTQAETGASSSEGVPSIPSTQIDDLQILDISILRDQDDQLDTYFGAYPLFGSSFAGASIYRGDPLAFVQNTSIRAIVGSVILPPIQWNKSVNGQNHFRGNYTDDCSRVVVSIPPDVTLSSCTVEQFNDAITNLALIGNEIVKFHYATALPGAGQWELYGIKRGRKGTEYWAKQTPLTAKPLDSLDGMPGSFTGDRVIENFTAAPGHYGGERFVLLLENGVDEMPISTALLNQSTDFAAVAPGQDPDAAIDRSFYLIGKRKLTWAPVRVRAVKTAGEFAITWTRRTRIGGDMTSGMEVPIGEAIEQYQVDIEHGRTSGGPTISSYLTGSQSFTWTTALQSAALYDGLGAVVDVAQVPGDDIGGAAALRDDRTRGYVWSDPVGIS